MDTIQLGICSVLSLFLLLGLGVPVAAALGVLGVLGLFISVGPRFALSFLETLPYHFIANYGWAVLPLFVLMGTLAESSGITMRMFKAANLWIGRLRGGLYLTVIFGSAGFAAASGSTTVNSVVFTKMALPEMIKYGYSRSVSLGCIAASGTFAAMIPPSITMVIFAIITEQSIGKLLLAGVIPGFLSALLYGVLIMVMVRVKPSISPVFSVEKVPLKERISSLKGVWEIIVLIIIVLGGIYAGVFPPSGAGAAGAFGTFLLALFKLGHRGGWLKESLINSVSTAAVIFAILLGGIVFSRFLVITGVIEEFAEFIASLAHTKINLIIICSLMYILLGCFLDTTSLMVVTLPFVFPIIMRFGIDPIWFGIIIVKIIEISVITPPVGINLYAVMSGAGKDANFRDLTVGVLPFILVDLITLAILITFPALSLWIPETMIQR